MKLRIPQLRNPWLIIPAILVVSVLTSYYTAYNSGQLQHWSQFQMVLPDFLLHAVMQMAGWILLRSPWAGKITEILASSSAPGPDGPTTTTAKVTISEPVAPMNKETEGNS